MNSTIRQNEGLLNKIEAQTPLLLICACASREFDSLQRAVDDSLLDVEKDVAHLSRIQR